MAIRLLLVRHGQAEGWGERRYHGHSDVPLTAEGQRQAEMLRDRLRREGLDAIYSSDLERALHTAQTIASPHDLDVRACPELREINFGALEGMKAEDAYQRWPQLAAPWRPEGWTFAPPGGESSEKLTARVKAWADATTVRHHDETILIVAHGGPLRALITHLLGLGPQHLWSWHLDLGSLSILELYPEGTALALLNDICHLEGRDGR